MLNFHLNGDIVHCPDIRAIQNRIKERNDVEKRCRYGIKEDNCPAWQNHVTNWMNVKKNNDCGRCSLSGTINCPSHNKQVETGNKKKSYKIDSQTYRKMSSAAHDLVKNSQYKTLFLTLTLPPFINKKNKPNETIINQCFSKFVENLRDTYNCLGYIAVREHGTRGHRLHYHIICAVPFIEFSRLNNAWCAALSNICHYSRNAIRTTKQTLFIKNPGKALRYVCKYFSKCRGQRSDTRLVFMSNNLIKKPIQRPHISLPDLLRPYKGVYINKTSDYTTCFRITDAEDFMKFCNDFLYDEFNKEFNFPIFKNNPSGFYVPGYSDS